MTFPDHLPDPDTLETYGPMQEAYERFWSALPDFLNAAWAHVAATVRVAWPPAKYLQTSSVVDMATAPTGARYPIVQVAVEAVLDERRQPMPRTGDLDTLTWITVEIGHLLYDITAVTVKGRWVGSNLWDLDDMEWE